MSLHKPKPVLVASKWQYTAEGGEVQVFGVVFKTDEAWETDQGDS